MKSSARLTVFLALLATLSLTSVASAHTLKVSRAAKANRTFTKLVCKDSNDAETRCVASKSSGCKRISAHRVRCSMYLTLESTETKELLRCRGLIEWVLNKRGKIRPDFLGFRSCVVLREPEAEGEPAPTP
jgi:hypothetical protein